MIEPSGFREMARSVKTTYRIHFAFALLLAFTVVTLGGGLLSSGPMRWVCVAFGSVSFIYALTLFAWAMVKRPELLMSEQMQLTHRIIDFVGESDLGPERFDVARQLLTNQSTRMTNFGASTRADEETSHE